ncbi:MAG: LamG domain-containing protein, partial [Isosphaeraceae bacterium]|nr:LamG domain-containing protein [Isosphaeraceae bacterium]
VFDDEARTHCRNWIRRPDRVLADPFGDRTVRANMHPGYQSPDVIGPSGPVDPAVSVVMFRTPEGRPLAVLANYSMHYFGASPVSADYFGRFAARVGRLLRAKDGDRPCVAMMSQGTSGDQHWMDYGRPKDNTTIESYSDAIADEVVAACRAIEFRPWVSLAMAESRVTLRRRTPDEKRLAWARPIVAAMEGRIPRSQAEVYAREAIYLHEEPERELKLQAVRLGDLGIAAIPNEVFALSGLQIKARSPLPTTFVMELANGAEGYIPSPEQHVLGGYNTWPARTAALEVGAEPKIVALVLGLLEKVAEKPQRLPEERHGPYARAVLGSKPVAYWRLSEMSGGRAADATGQQRTASFEGGVALYLEGPASPAFSGETTKNRAIHLAGGHLVSRPLELGERTTVEFWFWNGLPNDARPVTGVLLSEAGAHVRSPTGPRLTIGGRHGRLVLIRDPHTPEGVQGVTEIAPRSWHHVAMVREGEKAVVYLDGKLDLSAPLVPEKTAGPKVIHIGGAPLQTDNLEGRIDEVAVYDRALGIDEIRAHLGTVNEVPVRREDCP